MDLDLIKLLRLYGFDLDWIVIHSAGIVNIRDEYYSPVKKYMITL